MSDELNELEDIEVPYIPIDCEDIAYKIKYNSTDLKKGLKDASYYIGILTAIRNCGIDSEDTSEIFKIILNDIKK